LTSWREVVKALAKIGFYASRQRGSHIVLRRDAKLVVVPRHEEIDRGTLAAIIQQAGLTKEEFLKLLS
jgi:predicted RNA binding protein YcfA (HicA-like mRNA interferase family)